MCSLMVDGPPHVTRVGTCSCSVDDTTGDETLNIRAFLPQRDGLEGG